MSIPRTSHATHRRSVDHKAADIKSLQERGPLSQQQALTVRDLFVSTTGRDLEKLKRAVDHGGPVAGWLGGRGLDLRQLIESDISDPGVRDTLKSHFAAQAKATGEVVVYSDVDDTLVSKLNDKRFPEGTVYPGARAFLAALDAGPSGHDVAGDLVFLTARPRFLETGTHDFLKGIGLAPAVVLEGKLRDSLTFNRAERMQNYADRKVAGYTTHQSYFPERRGVFLGDNGQGDVSAALQLSELPADQRPRAMYIHDVVSMPASERANLAQRGIIVFDTYLDAAIDAFQKGLLSRGQLVAVRQEARDELEALSGLAADQRLAAESLMSKAELRSRQLEAAPKV